MSVFPRESAGRLTPRKIGNHFAEEACGVERLKLNIEFLCGLDAAMAEHTADKLVIAGIGLEHDIGGGVPELVRRDLESKLLPEFFRDLR
jgi:hypothetical protein